MGAALNIWIADFNPLRREGGDPAPTAHGSV